MHTGIYFSKENFGFVLLVQHFISGQYVHTCFIGYAASIC